ncbi:NUDIX hydrolase domain-like protein [Apodospora peruviana]|uniref:NUDIX hydrolase domain-like protein n=1 Tax=Apodospora peruviana TaxID=516989 RepID=A0AAE0ME41_9PEZI|nr:NUDIX hydrolase domain-like protein [Apodospora peruviana]
MAPEGPVVRVGVAAVIKNAEGKMVMGVRKGVFGGKWQFPGGHLEVGESYFACAERETLEEAGLEVRAEKLISITNDIFDDTKHYVTIFVACRRLDEEREPETLEPEKCEGWSWKSWSEMKELISTEEGKQKIFLPIINLLREHPDIEELV